MFEIASGKGEKPEGRRDLVQVSDGFGRSSEAQRPSAGTRGRPVAAFLAQLYGARVRRRRLELARENAPAIHSAYRGEGVRRSGRKIDLSV